TPLPLPQRPRGTDLAAETQGPAPHPPTKPRRRADLDRRHYPQPQPATDGDPHLIESGNANHHRPPATTPAASQQLNRISGGSSPRAARMYMTSAYTSEDRKSTRLNSS